MISLVPQHFINNTFRIDFDLRLNERSWIVLAPRILYKKQDVDTLNYSYSNTRKITEVKGYGFDISHKIFTRKSYKFQRNYLMYGVSYQQVNLKYYGTYWRRFLVDGLQYMLPQTGQISQTTSKYGFNVLVGNQSVMSNPLFFDLYLGTGIRFASHSSKQQAVEKFDTWLWDFGFEGVTLLAGFRMGVSF